MTNTTQEDPVTEPITEQIPSGDIHISVRILNPQNEATAPRSAILLFHGGGWNVGDASWMDYVALVFASKGMVAISVDYRLSVNGITPFDAVADSRNAVRWTRKESKRLGVNPNKIAVLGTSAGGHLALSTAIFDEPWGDSTSSVPTAVILRSGALSVERDPWFKKLTGGSMQAAALSPSLYVRKNLPPTLVLQGEKDSLTLASDAVTFCERMKQSENYCILKIYPGVGHLFTRNLTQQEIPDYDAIDKTIVEDANNEAINFLKHLSFIE